jgi:hypothetical protein
MYRFNHLSYKHYRIKKNTNTDIKMTSGVITVNDSSVLKENRTLKYLWKKISVKILL